MLTSGGKSGLNLILRDIRSKPRIKLKNLKEKYTDEYETIIT